MDTYPINPKYQLPINIQYTDNTVVSTIRNGREARRRLNRFMPREIQLTYNSLGKDDFDTLQKFYKVNAKGMLNTFYLRTIISQANYDEFIGTGDGATATFNLPAVSFNIGTETIYQNGTPLASTAYTINLGYPYTITFNTAPTAGDILTMDFEGELLLKCRFGSATFEYIQKFLKRFDLTVRLVEVLQ